MGDVHFLLAQRLEDELTVAVVAHCAHKGGWQPGALHVDSDIKGVPADEIPLDGGEVVIDAGIAQAHGFGSHGKWIIRQVQLHLRLRFALACHL